MRIPYGAAIVAAVLAASPALAEDLVLGRADAPIQSATVYARQALVKRVAAFDAKGGGPLKVTIARLPAKIHDDSVRVRSEAGLTLVGSRVVAHPVADSSQPAVAELRVPLRKVEAEKREVDDARGIALGTLKHIEAIEAAHASEASAFAKASPQELSALVDWALHNREVQTKTLRECDEKLADIERQRALAQQKLADLEHAPGFEKDLEVELQAAAGGHFRLEIEYVTEGASWSPYYDFRADADAKAIDITYYGNVKQSTGEDWTGVRLALSTARPELGARPPELPDWIVMMRPKYEPRGYANTRSGGAAPAATPPAQPTDATKSIDFDGSFEEGKVETAAPEQRGATVAFSIPTPETIPSDGKEKRSTVGRQSFKAENRYFTAPKASPYAYLRSTVVNGFAFPMLAGDANVFFGPDFVGRSKVDLVAQGEKFEIYLGVDERVKVERKLERRFRDTKGVFTSDVRQRYEYRIIATNSRDLPVQLTIVDQVPISRDEDVKIEDVQFSIEPTDKNEANGERRWNLGLAAKGKTELGIGFTIRFPEKREHDVLGVER